MAGKKEIENSHNSSVGQNTKIKQGPVSSGNPIQGQANPPRPNEDTPVKNRNTKQEANSGKDNRNGHTSKTSEQGSAASAFVNKGATNRREKQQNDALKPDPNGKGKNEGNETAKEKIPLASDRASTVARTTSTPPIQPARGEMMCDKMAGASKHGRLSPSIPAANSNVDKVKGKAREQDPRSGSEIASMFSKTCQRAATGNSTPISSRQPSPSKSTTGPTTQSAPSSKSSGGNLNDGMAHASIASEGPTKKKKTRGGRRKKKSSATDPGNEGGCGSSESDTSRPTKSSALPETGSGRKLTAVAEILTNVKPAPVIRIAGIGATEQSRKGDGGSSLVPSSANGDEVNPIKIENANDTKVMTPNEGQPESRGQIPGNSGCEEAFTGLGSGQGPSFTKAVNKRNRPRPSKAEKLLKRQSEAKADSANFQNNSQDIYQRPGSEGDVNEHSMISIADIPSDDELGAEKIEEIFGRNDVPDSTKLERIKLIMIKQNQIIARKTQLVNNCLKENETLQETVEEFDSSILTQEDDKNEQQGQIDKLKTMVDEFRRQMQSQESFIKIAEQDRSRLEEELKSSATSLKSAERDRKALKESVSKMTEDMAKMQNDIVQLTGEKNGFLVTISKYESELDMLLCQLHNGPTQTENVRLAAELLEKNAELAVANQNFKDLQREFTALRKREKKEQGRRMPSALNTELRFLGDGKEEEWEPLIDQSGVERNPFALLSSPVTPTLFQFGEPISFGAGGEKEVTYKIPKTFLHRTGEETKDSDSLVCPNGCPQTETSPRVLRLMENEELEVLEASTQTQIYVELGRDNSAQTNVVEMLEAFTQTIAGDGALESEVFEASTQTMCELGVSRGSQTTQLGFSEGSSQTEADVRVHTVKMLEAFSQTTVGIDFSTSPQTDTVALLEASTQTDRNYGACEMTDALVQTEPVTVLQGSGLARGIRLALIMFAWAAIMLWGHKEDQRLWLDANRVSRASLVAIRDRSLGPFLWLEQLKFELILWLQVDRVLPG
ncbi:conserved hypothetical protein [Histoplasma capsulatum var. duboisii H88]|uniref:Uncharacterized protein n=1 Tax=Ajellomyces capsulatus (strain H88) TaxID=544711 RepID=F0UER7_AJEC8|nr:conserved hypothetical protein [Histoplasma capsulatum var. duboisii H88]